MPPSHFLKIHYSVLPSTPGSCKWFLFRRSPPKSCMHLSSLPYAVHASPISFFSILSPEYCLVRRTDNYPPHYVVLSILLYLVPLRSKCITQHPVLKHPQPTFLPQCERPHFTSIQNSRQNCNYVYLNLYIFG